MLSSIEKGKYIPNSILLMQLCTKLGISLEQVSLHDNFNISDTQKFNDQLDELCNSHQYQELLNLLNQDEVIDTIDTDEQTQAYYYYLGIANFQVNDDLDTAIDNFKLSLSSTSSSQPSNLLKRLTNSSLGIIYAKLGQIKQSDDAISMSLADLAEDAYLENQNILYYLAGLAEYYRQDLSAASRYIDAGIQFATENNSHYMLANLYHLLAVCASSATIAKNAEQYEQTLTNLFSERVFKQI